MSSVPPNSIGSILQSNMMQRQVSSVRENKRSQESNAMRLQGTASDESELTVDTTDNDTQIHAEAEGSGSQGRAFGDGAPEEELQAEQKKEDGNDGGHILDIEA